MTPPYAGAAARVDRRGDARVPFSFELFPPRNAEVEARMPAIVAELASLGPEFISVTYGAGGSSRARSLDLLTRITSSTDVLAMAHLTCVGSSYDDATALIREFLDHGITNFLALRGDPPTGLDETDDFLGDLRSGAELVQLIHRVRRSHESYLSDRSWILPLRILCVRFIHIFIISKSPYSLRPLPASLFVKGLLFTLLSTSRLAGPVSY